MLLYAHDKVSELGPPVCASDFGGRTVKLLLLPLSAGLQSFHRPYSASVNRRADGIAEAEGEQLCYTLRNAAEQFLAARAPGGFYGNRFSTFSKGVALMRAARRSSAVAPWDMRNAEEASDWASQSFAYDCATSALELIKPVFTAHPGFHLLRPLAHRGDRPCPPKYPTPLGLDARRPRVQLTLARARPRVPAD